MLHIDGDGECQNCEDGVILSEVSISTHYGDNYTLNLMVDNNRLLLGQNEITFNVTGCPIGYGADSSNNTCSLCDTFYYNVDDDYVGQCLSCDPDDNAGDVVLE